MWRYKLKRIPKRKIVVWATLIFLCSISLLLMGNFYATTVTVKPLNSVINDTTVIVNTLNKDWNYYQSLNFSTPQNRADDITKLGNRNLYNKDTLVKVQITYDGHDINDPNLVGKVSAVAGEGQYKFVYYQYVYLPKGATQLKIPLIDNPYTLRPNGKAFNGWVCDPAAQGATSCDNIDMYYYDDQYIRYALVDESAIKTVNGEKSVIVNLKTSWIRGVSVNYKQDSIDDFRYKGMHPIEKDVEKINYDYEFNGPYYPFVKQKIKECWWGSSCQKCTGYWEENPNNKVNGEIALFEDKICMVEVKTEDEFNKYLDKGKDFFDRVESKGGEYEFKKDNITKFPPEKLQHGSYKYEIYKYQVKNGDSLAGYYYKRYDNGVPSSNTIPLSKLYNSKGEACDTIRCSGSVYQMLDGTETDLIQYELKTGEEFVNGQTECKGIIGKATICNVSKKLLDNNGTEVLDKQGNPVLYQSQVLLGSDKLAYMVTRDTNILNIGTNSIGSSVTDTWKNKPFTLTSNAYGSSNKGKVISSNIYARYDANLENVKLDNIYKFGVADANVKFGRHVYNNNMDNRDGYFMDYFVAGNYDENDYNAKSKVILESGAFSLVKSTQNYAYRDSKKGSDQNTILVLGSDYDKVAKNDDNLVVYDGVIGYDDGEYYQFSTLPLSEMIVKSGTFGYDVFKYDSITTRNYYTNGIYVGGVHGGDSNGYRTLKVEGGRIYNINGGPCVMGKDLTIGIFVNGGLIENIVGGAGTTKTSGGRMVVVSGGSIINAIAGGSNSFFSQSNTGPVEGSTLVYVGGDATLGLKKSQVTKYALSYSDGIDSKGGEDHLYGQPKRGNVYGAGLGTLNKAGSGVVYNSKVIINGGTINGDVYGGGNYGSIVSYVSGSNSLSGDISLEVLNGDIKGSVFGDSNSVGIANNSYNTNSTISVSIKGGTVAENVYGGSNSQSQSNATVNMNLYAGTIKGAVYGGGKGIYTNMNGEVNITSTPTSDDKLIIGSLYAGSELGTLNAGVLTNINGGTITNVFGGGKGSVDKNPDIKKGSILNINGGIITNIYGGHDEYGYFPYEDSSINSSNKVDLDLDTYIVERLRGNYGVVNINGGVIENAYGGGRGVGAKSYLTDINVNIAPGKGHINGNVYGGGHSAVTYSANNEYKNGEIKGSVYGGGNLAPTKVTQLSISGGNFKYNKTINPSNDEYSNAYGGGYKAGSDYSHVNILGGNPRYVFGGSNFSGIVANTNVTAKTEAAGKHNVCSIFGGGNNVETGETNVTVENGFNLQLAATDKDNYSNICGNVYGGDNFEKGFASSDAIPTTKSTNVNIAGNVINVYGGSNANGAVKQSNVFIKKGGHVNNVYGGSNNGGTTIDANVTIDVGNVSNSVYGGGKGKLTTVNNSFVTLSSGNVKGNIFGGGNNGPVLVKTDVKVLNGTVTNVFGGGNHSFVGDAVVNDNGDMVDGASHGKTGNAYVLISGGNILNNVYGSGNSSFVYGDTSVRIGDRGVNTDISIGGDIFGGSETNSSQDIKFDFSYQGVTGGATILVAPVAGFTFDGSLYGSGNNSAVHLASKITIDSVNPVSSKTQGVAKPHQMASIQRATEVRIKNSQIELFGARDRADSQVFKKSLVRVDKLFLEGNNANNGTHLYLLSGVKFLGQYTSGYYESDVFNLQTVKKVNDRFETKGDNRLFLQSETIMAVSSTDRPSYEVDAAGTGPVRGMTYFGMYEHDPNTQQVVKGQYDEEIIKGQKLDKTKYGYIKDKYSFVYGKNEQPTISYNKQMKNHGFYSQFYDEKTGVVTTNYVGMEPKEGYSYYKWILGEEKLEVNINLEANKYAENGTSNVTISLAQLKELLGDQLVDWQDATMTIKSVDDSGFIADLKQSTEQFKGYLVDKDKIPNVTVEDNNGDGVTDANNYFALTMGTTTTGWMDNYRTEIYSPNSSVTNTSCTQEGGCSVGDNIYIYDSTRIQRSLSFWLYHSKNLNFSYAVKEKEDDMAYIPMGTVKINVEFHNVHGDAGSTSSLVPVTLNVKIALTDGDLDTYGSKIAPGKQYEPFPPRSVVIPSDGAVSIYQSLALDLSKPMANSTIKEQWSVDKLYNIPGNVQVYDKMTGQLVTTYWDSAYRYLASSYLFPVGTKLTMIDLKNKEEYYYEVTQQIYNDKKAEFSKDGEYEYYLRDFIRMGSTTPDNTFDDDMNGSNSKKYYYKDKDNDLAVEEFIFTVNFEEVAKENRTKTPLKPYLYMSIARKVGKGDAITEQTVLLPKGIPQNEMVYEIIPEVDSKLETKGGFLLDDGTLSNNTNIYVGQSTDLKLTTSLKQYNSLGQPLNNVSDSKYDAYKLGALISVLRTKLDKNGQEMKGPDGKVLYEKVTTDLFGTIVKINGKEYFPQTDGSIRLELAGRVSNVISDVQIDFSNSSLDHRRYKLLVETFVTHDGLYYGNFKPTYNEFEFELLSNQYGLDFDIKPSEVTHDMNTGLDVNGNRIININLQTKNGLKSPNIKISLERKQNNGMGYEVRDLKDIFSSVKLSNKELLSSCYNVTGSVCNMYNMGSILSSIDPIEHKLTFTLKEGPSATDLADKNNAKWKSGTYRLVFTMYDGDTPIGSVYDYIIIRSLNVGEDIEGSK